MDDNIPNLFTDLGAAWLTSGDDLALGLFKMRREARNLRGFPGAL
jgi:hypothetical protein